MQLVASAFGDDVKNTAGRVPILGTKPAGFDLDFLYELKRKVCTRSAESGIGCVHAVEDETALRSGRSANRRIAVTPRCISQTRTSNSRSNRQNTLHRARGRKIRKLIRRNVRATRV